MGSGWQENKLLKERNMHDHSGKIVSSKMGPPQEAVSGKRYTTAILWLNWRLPHDVDEEDQFEIVRVALPAFATIAQEFGGEVRQRANGLTITYGVPIAYENDTERAVQTAYQILNVVQQRPYLPLTVQIAISSGIVLAGETTGQRQKETVILGLPINQAQTAATAVPGNQIWVTDSVRTATEHLFTYHPEPLVAAPDLSLWQVTKLRESPGLARGVPGVHTRFVGRDASLQAMVDLTQNLASGYGGIIWIEGEAGIGKSRLMREFKATLDPAETLLWAGGCSPQKVRHTFSLITDLLMPVFNVQATDSSEYIRGKIQQVLADWPADAHATQPYLEILAGIQPTGLVGERLNRLEPEQLRQQIFVAVRRLLRSLTKKLPLVVFLDDLHWIDPVSAELLIFSITAVASDPILFVCAQRREGSDAPNDRLLRLQSLLPGQTLHILLDRLSPENSQLLLHELLPGAQLPPDLREKIIVRSEGNPYFIEEFVRMFIEQGYVTKGEDKWHLVPERAFDPAAIPLSLETLIRSRIDALPEALKTTVQYASILGQEFDLGVLTSLTGNPDAWLSVERLASRLMLRPIQDTDRWRFSHTLYQSVVYDSMLSTHRQGLHHQAAQILEAFWADSETDQAKELAYHLLKSGDQLKALPYLIRAGEQAASQHAVEESLEFFRQASEIVTQLPQPDAQWQWRIAVGLGDVYRFIGQYDQSLTAFRNLLPLARTNLLSSSEQAGLFRRMGETCRRQGDYETAQSCLLKAQQIIGIPDDTQQGLELARTLIALAWVHFAQGHFAESLKTCEESFSYAKAADGLNELASAHNLLGGVYYHQGEWRNAFHHTTRAMILREQMEYSWGVSATLSNLGILAFVAGNWQKSISFFERSLSLRQEMGDVEGVAITQNNLGNAYRGQGKLKDAEHFFRESILTAKTFNISYHVANSSVGLAHVLLLQGQVSGAQSHIKDGLEQATTLGVKDVLAEAYRVQGEILLAQNAPEAALQAARQAADLATAVGNRSYEAAAWRVGAHAALEQQDLALAESLINKAAEIIAHTTDDLEAGHVAAQAFRIYTVLGNKELARDNLRAAKEIYHRLGSAFYSDQLNREELAQPATPAE